MPKKTKNTACVRAKVATVMREFHEGTLHSGSGKVVTSQKQAAAIAYSEARQKCKVGKKKKK